MPVPETQTLPTRADRGSKKQRGRERRRGLLILLSIFVLLAVLAAAARSYYQWASSGSGPRNPVTVLIPQGATGDDVANLLKDKGVIRSAFLFRFVLRLKHLSSSGFEAGEYHLTTNMSIDEAIASLQKGPIVHSVRVTVPEGLTVDQTAKKVAAPLANVTVKQFQRAAHNVGYPPAPYLPKKGATLEGFLFPNTYDFLKDADAHDVVSRAARRVPEGDGLAAVGEREEARRLRVRGRHHRVDDRARGHASRATGRRSPESSTTGWTRA